MLADELSLKSPQRSRALYIPADLTNGVVWMVSTHPDIFKSSNLFNNPSMTVTKASITIA